MAISDHSPTGALYVVEIDEGRIKVGYSSTPELRVARHRALAQAHGCTPDRHWVSPPGTGNARREEKLIDFCVSRATGRFMREYFTGVGFQSAALFAAELCSVERPTLPLSRTARTFPDRLSLLARPAGPQPLAVSVEEAATLLQTSTEHVEYLIEGGRLRVKRVDKLGRVIRIPTAALEEFVTHGQQ